MKKLFTLLSLFALTTIRAQSPDLKTGISFNYGWNPGPNEIFLTWDFFNVGGATANTFTIAYIASLDMNIDASDYLIEGVAYAGAVANAFATINYSVALDPDALPTGNYNFIVFIDYGNDVTESNETNNIVKFGSFNFTNQATTIQKHQTEHSQMTVFPNPAEGIIHITVEQQKPFKDPTYMLYDILGNTLLNGSLTKEASKNNTIIDLKDIPAGVYFLTVKDGEKIIGSRKIMVR